MDIPSEDNRSIDKVVELLSHDQHLFFVTGAGVSADSGLPTYRGTGGIYTVDNTEDNMPIERALSGGVFRSHPEITWKYLAQIAQAAHGAKFNRGHQVIAEMEQSFKRVCVLTQNVDGFHSDAGSQNVIEIHGNLRKVKCTQCNFRNQIDANTELEVPPYCPQCQTVLRPEVVLFGEMLPVEALAEVERNREVGFDVVFSIGTTSVFPYIAEPFVWASENGLPTIEINPDETAVSNYAEYRIGLTAAKALDLIWKRFRLKHGHD